MLRDFGKFFPLFLRYLFLFWGFFLCGRGNALVPLEGVLLGSFIDQYQKEITDPLYYVFRDYKRESEKENSSYKKKKVKFSLYRGFIEEGMNLKDRCRSLPPVDYSSVNELENAKRVYLSTLQFMILDVSTKFLPLYADYFDFSESDYKNFVEGLVGNFCSQNLTSISLKQLKTNMLVRYQKSERENLPSLEGDPYFPQRLKKMNTESRSKEQEFSWTIDLFKSACSWSNDISHLGLLVPLARHPVIAAAVIREISGLGLSWDEKSESVAKIKSSNSLRLSCRHMICRRNEEDTFLKEVPRTVGSSSLLSDFERLYCSSFKEADYSSHYRERKIEKIIKSLTFDEQYILSNQLISLMTGYPDYFVRADKFSDMMDFMRSSVDESWELWAKGQDKSNRERITYEERLRLNIVDPQLYFKRKIPKFSLEVDVDQGAFDESISILGKLRVRVNLDFTHKFLSWARREWKRVDEVKEKKKAERIRIPFHKRIQDAIADLNTRFPVVPWGDQFEDLIIGQILYEIASYEGDFFIKGKGDKITIPLYLNFSPFALKYMRYRYLIKKNSEGGERSLMRLRRFKL